MSFYEYVKQKDLIRAGVKMGQWVWHRKSLGEIRHLKTYSNNFNKNFVRDSTIYI